MHGGFISIHVTQSVIKGQAKAEVRVHVAIITPLGTFTLLLCYNNASRLGSSSTSTIKTCFGGGYLGNFPFPLILANLVHDLPTHPSKAM